MWDREYEGMWRILLMKKTKNKNSNISICL